MQSSFAHIFGCREDCSFSQINPSASTWIARIVEDRLCGNVVGTPPVYSHVKNTYSSAVQCKDM